jgi:hypothetical protein
MAKTKRGRPPKPPAARKRNNLTIRVRDKLKADLEANAAGNQRSLSEEAEFRLERSFSEESFIDHALGGADMRQMAILMISAFSSAGRRGALASGHPEWTPAEWLQDPYCYKQAMLGALQALAPAHPGELSVDDLIMLMESLKGRIVTQVLAGTLRQKSQ